MSVDLMLPAAQKKRALRTSGGTDGGDHEGHLARRNHRSDSGLLAGRCVSMEERPRRRGAPARRRINAHQRPPAAALRAINSRGRGNSNQRRRQLRMRRNLFSRCANPAPVGASVCGPFKSSSASRTSTSSWRGTTSSPGRTPIRSGGRCQRSCPIQCWRGHLAEEAIQKVREASKTGNLALSDTLVTRPGVGVFVALERPPPMPRRHEAPRARRCVSVDLMPPAAERITPVLSSTGEYKRRRAPRRHGP
jgi:hypothetical protein